MNQPARKTEWLVWGGLVAIMAVVAGVYLLPKPRLAGPLPVIGPISDFHLTNQNSEAISLESLRGKVWVADLIFTRCPGPCLKMTKKFAELQAALPAGQPVRLVSLSSDPENDTPAVLRKYAAEYQADPAHWWFLTGPKQQLYDLAINDFKFVITENKATNGVPPEGIIGHSTWFALVDQKGQVRGWQDAAGGTHATFESDDAETPARLLAAIRKLLKEPPP